MIDNKQKGRFELEENAFKVLAEYRIHDGCLVIAHVEADPPLRGTGASGRLMQAIVEHARALQLAVVPRCSYAQAWFERHPEAQDILPQSK